MSLNYAQLTQAIQDTTQNDEATFVSNIPIFVRSAENTIYTTTLLPNFRKSSAATPLTASSPYYSWPNDFIAPFEFLVNTSGSILSALIIKDVSWLREAFPDPAVTGTPRYYAVFSDTQAMVSPTPSGNNNVELHYYYHPASIVTAGTSWVGNNYENVLLYGSLVNAYTFMKGEPELLKTYDQLFKEGLVLLKKVGDGMSRTDTFKTAQTMVPIK